MRPGPVTSGRVVQPAMCQGLARYRLMRRREAGAHARQRCLLRLGLGGVPVGLASSLTAASTSAVAVRGPRSVSCLAGLFDLGGASRSCAAAPVSASPQPVEHRATRTMVVANKWRIWATFQSSPRMRL